MRPLIDRRFKCSVCGSMFVSLWPFVTRDEADAWATNTALVNR
jgi:transposase